MHALWVLLVDYVSTVSFFFFPLQSPAKHMFFEGFLNAFLNIKTPGVQLKQGFHKLCYWKHCTVLKMSSADLICIAEKSGL